MHHEREFIPDATGSDETVADDSVAADRVDDVPADQADTAVIEEEPDFLVDFDQMGRDEPAAAAETAAIEDELPTGETPIADETLIERDEEPLIATPVDRRSSRPRREKMHWTRRFAILGGADGVIIDRVPMETPRYVQMFFVLAGTALVSALSMLFALITGVQLSVWLALPLAVVWALIIFNLDRFLTSTMKSTRNLWKLIGLAIPRVIMAAIIGVVVAEPLVLQVFHNDISREVTSTNIAQAQADQDGLETGPEKKALDSATERLNALENQASTGIVAGTSSQSATSAAAQATVDNLTKQMAEQQKTIDQARLMYQCELTGEGAGEVAGCTGMAGEGTSSNAAKTQLEQAQSTYDGLAAQLRDAQKELSTAEAAGKSETSASEATNRQQAKDQLPAAQKSYDAALAAYNARAESVAGTNAGAIGLLSQITGLNRLGEKEPALKWAHWLIAALFFMIELLPVLVKVLTSYGDKTLYEKADEIARQVELDRVTADGFRERAAIVTT